MREEGVAAGVTTGGLAQTIADTALVRLLERSTGGKSSMREDLCVEHLSGTNFSRGGGPGWRMTSVTTTSRQTVFKTFGA